MKNPKLLTRNLLKVYHFSNIKDVNVFEGLEMSYWVKNGVCLFYNTPTQLGCESNFLIGYGSMRGGKYVAVTFKWIKTFDELTTIYEAINGKLTNKKVGFI